jgi:anti-anti-sigma regulatory factor|tara:strand:- start:77720 stop:78268 length:549 start_codon:yes stop_codon:yes gene_type:complete
MRDDQTSRYKIQKSAPSAGGSARKQASIMHSQITIIGEMGLIDLSGIVDDTDAGRLHDWIVDFRLQGTERVVVDLTELTWVRRSARASLIEIAELLEAEGGRVLIGARVIPIEDLLEGLRSGGRAVSNPALRAFFSARTPALDTQAAVAGRHSRTDASSEHYKASFDWLFWTARRQLTPDFP